MHAIRSWLVTSTQILPLLLTLTAAGEMIEDRLGGIEAEVAALKSQSAQFAEPQESVTCESPAWNVGAELTLLRLHVGALALKDVIAEEFEVTPDYDLDAAFRVWIAREYASGLGWRVRFWNFDDQASLDFGDVLFRNELGFYTVDLEVTKHMSWTGCDLRAVGGVRIAGIDADYRLQSGDEAGWLSQDFHGAGLTFALEGQHRIGASSFSVYGSARGSLVYGATDVGAGVENIRLFRIGTEDVSLVIGDRTVAIWELKLGLQYERQTRLGTVFAQAGVESQLWELPPVALGLGDENIGLFGPTFTIGLER